jgi:hypothetical protein
MVLFKRGMHTLISGISICTPQPSSLTTPNDTFHIRALFCRFPTDREHQTDQIPRRQVDEFALERAPFPNVSHTSLMGWCQAGCPTYKVPDVRFRASQVILAQSIDLLEYPIDSPGVFVELGVSRSIMQCRKEAVSDNQLSQSKSRGTCTCEMIFSSCFPTANSLLMISVRTFSPLKMARAMSISGSRRNSLVSATRSLNVF